MRRFVGFATMAALMVAFAGCMGGEDPATAPGDENCPPGGTNDTTNTTANGDTSTGGGVSGENATGNETGTPGVDNDCPPTSDTNETFAEDGVV